MDKELLQKMLEICENNLSEGEYLQMSKLLMNEYKEIEIINGNKIEFITKVLLYRDEYYEDDDCVSEMYISKIYGDKIHIRINNDFICISQIDVLFFLKVQLYMMSPLNMYIIKHNFKSCGFNLSDYERIYNPDNEIDRKEIYSDFINFILHMIYHDCNF